MRLVDSFGKAKFVMDLAVDSAAVVLSATVLSVLVSYRCSLLFYSSIFHESDFFSFQLACSVELLHCSITALLNGFVTLAQF